MSDSEGKFGLIIDRRIERAGSRDSSAGKCTTWWRNGPRGLVGHPTLASSIRSDLG